ncbi:PTS cellobiose transporter subunit IIC [Cetobacterium sp.]|uniref:PTS cellobiose transporter subunit IIC n=1 Tax=Cetobacterium sp. TaxID=2071632 RepID=UPI0025C11436|nr:PTS cellobiose transporter subunit IIC [Cetobacterium sp.]
MSAMDRLNNFLEKNFLPIAMKISSQTHIQSVRDGLTLSMPLLIVGSVFLIFGFLPIPGYPEFMTSIFGPLWKARILYPVQVTFDIMALFIAIGVAYRLAERKKVDPLSCAAISLTAFLLLTPFNIAYSHNDILLNVKGIDLGLIGSRGIFVAIITGLSTTEIVKFAVDKNLVIKMPDSVPPAVSKSFSALIPAMLVVLLALTVRIIFEITSFEHIHNFILTVIGKPLTLLGGSFIGTLLAVLAAQLLWSMGLHGPNIVGSVMTPIWLGMMDQNRIAFQAGEVIPNISGSSFVFLASKLGGSGLTLGLTFFMAFFAKSKQLKEIGKMSLGPGIFNINEPIIFGTPIVMNPILIIPFIVAPLVTTTITYFGMKFGIIALTNGINVPWTLPAPIYGFLVTGGHVSGAIIGTLVVVISCFIYYPFFKIYDAQKVKEEWAIEEESKQNNSSDETSGDFEII